MQQQTDNPYDQLRAWLAEARTALPDLYNAMSLATVAADGRPGLRIVLLKDVSDSGMTFYTNYYSRKARDLEAVPSAAALFWWPALQRQIRIEGAVSRVSAAESDAYFATRERDSQLGAWASEQSTVLPSREALEQRIATFRERFAGEAVPRPPHWGGYRITPDVMEFWQEGAFRLHDRFRYRRAEAGWIRERLAP